MKRTFSPRPDLSPTDSQITNLLRKLPLQVPPARVTSSLMELAHSERQRTLAAIAARVTVPVVVASGFQKWRERLQFSLQNMMRPLAVPFAGGMFSAITLFSLWVVPAYPFLAVRGRADVPTSLNTMAKIKGTSSMIGVSGAEVIVDIMVDGQGRMVDYVIVSGGANLADPHIRSGLENLLVFTQFVPATAFGQPKSGRLRLSLSSSSINVKG